MRLTSIRQQLALSKRILDARAVTHSFVKLHTNVSRCVKAYEGITLKDFAIALDVSSKQELLESARDLDDTVKNQNSPLSKDLLELLADEWGETLELIPKPTTQQTEHGRKVKTKPISQGQQPSKATKAKPVAGVLKRPPIVTIMGHVDHGKTTLLDAFRSSSIAAGEAGGITQHIGAFQVSTPRKQTITFLDTPGHAAFSAMRQRGALCTDVVILVVAADDGVMPQTKESVGFAKEAQVPIVVAINKCDKPEAKPDHVMSELNKAGLELEAFGGDVQCVQVSALEKTGLEELEEAVLLQAELVGLDGDVKAEVEGVIVEATSDKFKGQVATVLLRNGTVKQGDILVAGEAFAKVKSLVDDGQKKLKSIGPSMAAEIMGWRTLPTVGSPVIKVANEAAAREAIAAEQRLLEEEKDMTAAQVVERRRQLEAEQRKADIAEKRRVRRLPRRQRPVEIKEREMADAEVSDLPERLLVIKTDVQGSIEALVNLVEALPKDEVNCRIVRAAVGPINDTDIQLAETLDAWVVGFGVKLGKKEQQLAKSAGVKASSYNIVYAFMEDLQQELLGLLPPVMQEKQLGKAKVLQVFKLTGKRKSTVAGCRVQTGELQKDAKYRLLRKGNTLHEGPLAELKHHKDSVETVKINTECGASFSDFTDIQQDDELVCFVMEEVKRERL